MGGRVGDSAERGDGDDFEALAATVEGVGDVKLELVWDPPWSPDMMSEVAKLALNM